jgi:hypothetical protein
MNLNISENESNERKPLLGDLNEINRYDEDDSDQNLLTNEQEHENETNQNSEYINRNATQLTSSSIFYRNVHISDEQNPLHRVNIILNCLLYSFFNITIIFFRIN